MQACNAHVVVWCGVAGLRRLLQKAYSLWYLVSYSTFLCSPSLAFLFLYFCSSYRYPRVLPAGHHARPQRWTGTAMAMGSGFTAAPRPGNQQMQHAHTGQQHVCRTAACMHASQHGATSRLFTGALNMSTEKRGTYRTSLVRDTTVHSGTTTRLMVSPGAVTIMIQERHSALGYARVCRADGGRSALGLPLPHRSAMLLLAQTQKRGALPG